MLCAVSVSSSQLQGKVGSKWQGQCQGQGTGLGYKGRAQGQGARAVEPRGVNGAFMSKQAT